MNILLTSRIQQVLSPLLTVYNALVYSCLVWEGRHSNLRVWVFETYGKAIFGVIIVIFIALQIFK